MNTKCCQHVQERLDEVIVVSWEANVMLTNRNLTTVCSLFCHDVSVLKRCANKVI